MWRVIEKNKKPFLEYMKRKASLLGLEKLSWFDLEAPLQGSSGPEANAISYDDAAKFIIEKFTAFSPKMGDFARRAFEQKWIEAEDRKGKRPGGFCTDIPLNKASRIFMTYSGTKESVLTLAHELGHAFHNHVIFEQPEMARHFPMNLAETASTFAEMIMSEAAFKQETDPQKRIILLDGKIQRSIVFLFNIHARFLFDVRFHEERKKGVLSGEELGKLMETAQKEAYCDALDVYHPFFWASKMHFSSTGVPFYNFPYTFGFLFSLGVYLRAHEDKNFEDRYIALLADTGKLGVEDLAKKHLDVDLGKEHFWEQTLDFLKRDVQQFLEST
jgi:pepF/M3 family oligoendopeptidase